MPSVTINTIDHSQSQMVFAPSWEEIKAIEAASKNETKAAKDWFDRALINDPMRGPRIFNMCRQLNSPLSKTYAGLSWAARANDAPVYAREIARITERHPELPNMGAVKRAELIDWADFAARTNSLRGHSATDTTKLKKL